MRNLLLLFAAIFCAAYFWSWFDSKDAAHAACRKAYEEAFVREARGPWRVDAEVDLVAERVLIASTLARPAAYLAVEALHASGHSYAKLHLECRLGLTPMEP